MATLISANSSSAATVFTAATEVVAISSLDQINTLDASQGMVIAGEVTFTAGATPGTVTVTVRQGVGTGGAIVKSWIWGTTIASVNQTVPVLVTDPTPLLVGPGNAALPVYSINLTIAGSAGTGVYATIEVQQPTAEN